MTQPTRRVSIDLRRWPLGVYFGLKPTIVIEGRAQPTQWGVGTWQLPADRDTEIAVFLYQAGMTWGRATTTLRPDDAPALESRSPAIAGMSGRLGAPGTTSHAGAPFIIAWYAVGLAVIAAVVAVSLILF